MSQDVDKPPKFPNLIELIEDGFPQESCLAKADAWRKETKAWLRSICDGCLVKPSFCWKNNCYSMLTPKEILEAL